MNKTLANNLPLSRQHREGSWVIQIHPTLNCNIDCIHCYSSSAPGLKDSLNIDDLKYFLSSAFDVGYSTIAVSGGEPFLYKSLGDLLEFSHETGYHNSVTTNGSLLKSKRNQEILHHVDLLAISLDGDKDQHNKMRNSSFAFDKMLEGIDIAKSNSVKFGFIHTLRNEPLEVFQWLCDFTFTHGGKLLHFHPIESAGRGTNVYDSLKLSTEQMHSFFILYTYFFQKHISDFYIQLDLLHKQYLIDYPGLVYVYDDNSEYEAVDYLKELIIDETGEILPIAHGSLKMFSLGNIKDRKNINELLCEFKKYKLEDLKSIYKNLYDSILKDDELELFNFPALVADFAESFDFK